MGGNLVADPIAELISPQGALISMYLERPSPGGFAALISDLGRDVRESARERSREVQKSVEADLRQIRDRADQFESESAPAYAVFASSINGIWEAKPLTHEVRSVSVLGSRPYLRPLRSIPRPIRTAILVADRSQARIFVGFDEEVEEVVTPMTADIGKSNYGGFSGYEEHGVRSRAHEVASRLWKGAGEFLLDRHQNTPFDLLLIGGQEESIDDIRSELHPYLLDLPSAAFPASPADVTPTRLRSELANQRADFRRQREFDLVEKLLASAGRENLGVMGLNSAIHAANVQGVSDLVVAGDFTRPGTMCPRCGYIDRLDETCAVCGDTMHQVNDIVSAVMDATISTGGRVHQVLVGSALDRHGIGALIRFPVAPVD